MVTESDSCTETINFITKYSKSYQTTLIHSSANAHPKIVSCNPRLIKNNAKVKLALQKLKQSPIIT